MIALAAAMTSSLAYGSGATSSGGGNSIHNQANPWFLENTAAVSYCIEIDETNMGLDTIQAVDQVQRALSYWQTSFALTDNDHYAAGELQPYGEVRLVTQVFTYQSKCIDSTDLRFQFGILSASQIEEIGDPTSFIGIAMRSEYDSVNLKGRGYIYVSPQDGILKPKSPYFLSNAWSMCNGCLFQAILRHELGHVFGLKHYSSSKNIMSKNFPANATHSKYHSNSYFLRWLLHFIEKPYFQFRMEPVFVGNLWDTPKHNHIKTIFGLAANENSLKIVKITDSKGESDYTISTKLDGGTEWKKIGSFCQSGRRFVDTFQKSRGVTVFVDEQQKVFNQLPPKVYHQLAAYKRDHKYVLSGRLCSSRGTPETPLLVQIVPDSTRKLGGLFDGIIDVVLMFDFWLMRTEQRTSTELKN